MGKYTEMKHGKQSVKHEGQMKHDEKAQLTCHWSPQRTEKMG